MRYISIFSGIEAASVAWEPLGWEPVVFSEIDPFPCAVLKERFPNVPNLGDVSLVDWSEYRGSVDVVVGGSPCQSFSIAGKREGLQGESGLMFEYIRCVREVMPRYFVWENVPGALSSEKGAAFGQLLSEMDGLGYGLAWRVLDAQFFGVAQRRRRVFLVGSLGDMRASEILFEPDCLRWDTPSSREKRQELAAEVERSIGNGCLCRAGLQVNSESYEDMCPAQSARQYKDPPVVVIDRAAYNQGMNAQYNPHIEETDVMDNLVARGPHAVMANYIVRRLTPTECERLQGFPDGWTDTEFKGKPATDSPRYKALGNSMAVPVMRWIGERIAALEASE